MVNSNRLAKNTLPIFLVSCPLLENILIKRAGAIPALTVFRSTCATHRVDESFLSVRALCQDQLTTGGEEVKGKKGSKRKVSTQAQNEQGRQSSLPFKAHCVIYNCYMAFRFHSDRHLRKVLK